MVCSVLLKSMLVRSYWSWAPYVSSFYVIRIFFEIRPISIRCTWYFECELDLRIFLFTRRLKMFSSFLILVFLYFVLPCVAGYISQEFRFFGFSLCFLFIYHLIQISDSHVSLGTAIALWYFSCVSFPVLLLLFSFPIVLLIWLNLFIFISESLSLL